jgi:beta-phosphoglucomutase
MLLGDGSIHTIAPFGLSDGTFLYYDGAMKKAGIFDLDGTLVSSVGLHEKAWQKLFNSYGITLSDTELKEQSGKKNILFIETILERRSRQELDPQTLSDEKDEMVVTVLTKEPSVVYEGAQELLEKLKAEGKCVILATSATRKTAVLLGKELMHYFDAAIFAEDVEHGKPNPEMFLKAAEKLGLVSHECIVFEDAKSGVEAAKAGGFFCIARDNGLGQDLSEADLVVREFKPAELMEYFERETELPDSRRNPVR